MPEVAQQQQPAMQPQMPPQAQGQQAPYMAQSQIPQMPQQGTNFVSQDNVADERDVAFENAFRDAAYSIFNAKYPELTPQVVTFKVIKSKIDSGDAVGAFILSLAGEAVYIPVVMSDSMLKPMEILYSKKMDKFLPFNKDWLGVIFSTGSQAMGEGVQAPASLPRDVDISTMIYPPLDGRVSIGMDLSDINHLHILEHASNQAKEQYKTMLTGDRKHLKFASAFFDLSEIKSALTPKQEKVASQKREELEIFDMNTPVEKIREHYRDTSYAMSKIAREGMIYKDNRVNLNSVLLHDSKVVLENPTHSGAYIIYEGDGSYLPALVITNPKKTSRHELEAVPCYPGNSSKTKPVEMLVILPDGSWFEQTGSLAATPTNAETFRAYSASARDIYDVIYGSKVQSTAAKTNITLIKKDGDIIQATHPRYVDVTEVTRDKHKKYVHLEPRSENKAQNIWSVKDAKSQVIHEILHADTNTGKVLTPTNKMTVVPTSFKLLKLGDRISTYESSRFLKTPDEVLLYLQQKLNSKGGKKVKVQNTGMGEYAINNRPVGDLKTGVKKLAQDFAISMDDSVSIFKKVSSDLSSFDFYVWPSEKRANMFAGTSGAQMTPEALQQSAMGDQQQAAQSQMAQAQPAQPQDPQMMQLGMQSQDPNLYSLGVLNSLAHNPDILELLSVYSPVLEKALDSAGRMLLTFWIKGAQAKSSLGEEAYFSAEDSLRTVFKGIGSLLLKLQRQSATAQDQTGM